MYDWPSAASATESAYLFDVLVAESPRPAGGAAVDAGGIGAVPQVVGLFGALQLQQRGHGLGAIHAQRVLAIRRQGEGGEDADDHEHDEQFEQCNAARGTCRHDNMERRVAGVRRKTRPACVRYLQ